MAGRPSTRRTTPKGTQARARILAEATRIFARDGYRAGSLAAIAEAAGLTQPGLLHYFPTKAALLLALIEDRDARTAEFVREHGPDPSEPSDSSDTDSHDRAETALDGFIDGVRHNIEEPHLVELMTVLSAESISPDHPAHDWFVGRYDGLVARLAAGVSLEQRVGRWRTDIDPVDAARILVGLADGLRLQRLLGHPDLDHAALLADLLERLRAGTTA